MCFPGAKINRIAYQVQERLVLKNRNSCLISHVGSNNVFPNGRIEQKPEEILDEFTLMTTKIKEKTDKAIIIGVLPRLNENMATLKNARAINYKMGNICRGEGIKFVDPWDKFTDSSLFANDRVHLNNKGKIKFGEVLTEALLELLENNSQKANGTNENQVGNNNAVIGTTSNREGESYVNLPSQTDGREALPESGAIPKNKKVSKPSGPTQGNGRRGQKDKIT
jgi:hypothetical protein